MSHEAAVAVARPAGMDQRIGQDANGWWWGSEHRPDPGDQGWYENEVGRYRKLTENEPPSHRRDTLQRAC